MAQDSFGDDEPEDGYDASDPPPVILRNFIARIKALRETSTLSERNDLRVEQLLEDLETLRERLNG